MKVSVSFGDMRIIVPCGDGELLVSELIERAVSRYKKAIEKGEHCVVQVKYLETVKEHGRLDVDDKVGDVCDDKDLLTAVYNVGNKHVTMDDVVVIKDDLSTGDQTKREEETGQYVTSALSDNDSGVAADVFGLPSNTDSASKPPRGLHRQPSKNKNSSFRSSISSNSPSSSPDLPRHALKSNTFARDSNRKSLSTNHPILYKWIDQQETASYMGNHQSQDEDSDRSIEREEIHLDEESVKCVEIRPYTNAEGVEIGLVVQNIIEGCYVDCIGELQIADRITEVNGISLQGFSNEASLSIFNEALKLGEITLKRTRSHSFLKERLKKVDASILNKELSAITPPKQILKQTVEEDASAKESAVEAPTVDAEEKHVDVFTVNLTKGSNGLGFTVTTKDVVTCKSTRIFIKNILSRGAAIQDGRIQPGDELLMVNDVSVCGKTQTDVVKLLRQAEGTVILKLSRIKGNIPPAIIKTQPNVTPPTSPLIKKQQLSTPIIKASLPSPHIKTPLGPSPLMKNALEPSPLLKSLESSPIPILKKNKELESSESKDVLGKDIVDEAPVCKGYVNLTIPISIQSNVGLGISVKGKIMKETGDEKGIFVKSIVPGTNAEKDGRVFVGDQLISINDVSLTNMSNSAAMAILKRTLTEAGKDGVIRINVNRSVHAAESTDSESAPSHTSCGSLGSQSEYNQMMNKVEDKVDIEKQFDQLYLTESSKCKQRDNENVLMHHGVNRNKSYFKAVGGHASPKSLELSSATTVKTNDSPLTQASQPIFFQPEKSETKDKSSISSVDGKLWGVNNKEKDMVLPTYEEALQHRESNLKTDKNKSDAVKFNLPVTHKNENRTLNKSISLESSIRTPESDSDMDAFKMTRGISAVSQSSIDSILVDSNKIPFTRDGPGRLSMSEKKGRAHIDATKSRFYNKLKKFKSMEELRAPEGDNFKLNHDYGDMDMRRVSSIDTITSRLDEEEKNAALFNRGTVYSSSTPYYTNDEQRNRVGQRLRARNNALNESFKSALERTKSTGASDKENAEEKKKKGFLNSIGIFLKRAKKRKDDEFDTAQPEYITNPSKFPFNQKALLDVYEDVENNNKHVTESMNTHISDPTKYLQADLLQKQLVEAKINEMHLRDRKDKSKKQDTQKSNINKNESTPKKQNEKPYVPLTGYHTWQAHDPKNMREKSKQFFTRDSVSYQSAGSNSLQRQASLPPKNSTEVHRVLPRAPSGPMYKSPDRSKLRNDHTSPNPSTNKQNSESRNHKKHEKDLHHRTPGKTKSNEHKRYEHNSVEDGKEASHRVVRRQDSNDPLNTNTDTTINRRSMPSISDLKLRSSVSISHKAQI